MPFVKLDCGILDSTLWVDRAAREVFITALLMADPVTTDEPSKQIEVRTFNETGWAAPPGNYGFVAAAGVGILARAKVANDEGLTALERLGSPEPDSRSPEFEGRRLVRVAGGYLVLNYAKYRERDYTLAERQKRWRDRQRNAVTSRSNAVISRSVTHADEEAEAHGNAEKTKRKSARSARQPDASRLPEDFALTPERRAYAESESLNAERVFAGFCDHWRAAAGPTSRKRDWDAAWRNWCRRQHDMNGNGRTAEPRKTRYEQSREALERATVKD